MAREDLLGHVDAVERDECPLADDDEEHRTTRPNERLHCDDCDRTFYS